MKEYVVVDLETTGLDPYKGCEIIEIGITEINEDSIGRNYSRLIKPKIIVCLGRIAAQKLISEDFRVTKQHGEFFQKGNILFMGTFHPAALLRNPLNKPDALSDFQKLRDKINELNIEI